MNERAAMKKKIYEIDFALYELVLFLDSHPTSRRAMQLMAEYRKKRDSAVAEYESKYGKYIVTTNDVPMSDSWKWIDGPWPWDTDFMEG